MFPQDDGSPTIATVFFPFQRGLHSFRVPSENPVNYTLHPNRDADITLENVQTIFSATVTIANYPLYSRMHRLFDH